MVEGDRAKRRLAAIVAADVAGFSRLVGEDEEGTLARLKALRRELVDPKIAEYSGRVVKTTGDGLLLEFGSAVDAIRCVVDIQRAIAALESGLAEDKQIRFRIGVNVGWGGARFPETAHCATDRKDGGRAWTEIMGWNRV